MNVKEITGAVVGLITSTLAITQTSDWTTGALLAGVILFGTLLGITHVRDRAELKLKLDNCEDREDENLQRLHRRDVALSILWDRAREATGGRRRLSVPPLAEIIGDINGAEEEARTITGFKPARRKRAADATSQSPRHS